MRQNRTAGGLQTLFVIGFGALSACTTGITGAVRGPGTAPVPMVTSLSTSQASVGDPISFFGEGFPLPSEGWVSVHFLGTFFPSDGSTPNPVDFSVPLQPGLDGSLTWQRFGEYRVPFLPSGDKLGRFEGTVFAENHFFAGATEFFPPEQEGTVRQEVDALTVTFHVLPSVVVLDNRAFGDDFIADCVDPTVEVLTALRYALRVKALGFAPARFEFTTSPGLLQESPALEAYITNEDAERFGFASNGANEFALVHRWSPPPSYSVGYYADIGVTARGVGIERAVVFPFIVRPWTYPLLGGRAELAEIFPAEAVSGCIPGGPASLAVSYREGRIDSRSRELGAAVRRDVETIFSRTFEETYDFSQKEGFATTRSQSVSTGDTTTQEASQSVTDLFAGTNSRTTSNTTGTEFEWGGWDITTRSRVGTDLTAVYDKKIIKRAGRLEAAVPIGGAVLEEEIGFDTGPVRTTGTVTTNTDTWIDTWENSVGRQSTVEEMNSTTLGLNVTQGHSVGRAQSYENTVGFASTVLRERQETYGQALATSQSVSEGLGTTEEEVLIQASSEEVSVGTSTFCWAGSQCMWFRQTVRMVNRGGLVSVDLCGNSAVVGEISLNSWQWAADLGIDRQGVCPPATNLPPAECRIPPCTNQ